jgi:hypothetical protein
MSQSKNAKKLALFQRGAAAAQKYTGLPEVYFCPICQTGFDKSSLSTGELTLEHVPPAAVGGKGIVLTCQPCNNKAGDSIDAALKKRSDLIQFAETVIQGKTGIGGYASLQIGDDLVNAYVQDANGILKLETPEYMNDPKVIKRVDAYFMSLAQGDAWKGAKFHITSQTRCNFKLAKIGDLRAAFLVAFAAFGYRYAFDPRLDIVRQQILNPTDNVIKAWTITLTQPKDNSNLLLFVKSLQSIVVKFGRVGILLPWLNSSKDFYSELVTKHESNIHMNIDGEFIKWPAQLDMALDFPPPGLPDQVGH